MLIDGDGRIEHVGPSLKRLLPTAEGKTLSSILVGGSATVDTSQDPSHDWADQLVQLHFANPKFGLRGEFVANGDGSWLFAGVLDPSDADRLTDLGLTAADFSASDLTMDFSMLKWSRDSQVRETRLALLRLRQSISTGASLQERVDTDALTGVASRSRFIAELDEAMAKRQSNLAVMMIDIDRFKAINDLSGHDVGDQALKRVAQHLDWVIGEAGMVGRMGGDEFAIVLNNAGTLDADLKLEVDRLCDDIVALNHEPIMIGTNRVLLQLSVGVAFHTTELDSGTLLRHADIAMYAGRKSMLGPVGVFDPKAQRELEVRRSLADELLGAMDRGEIELLFQPIVELRSRQVIKFEVLSRWHHAVHGPVPPSLFFDVAEQCHLIRELDHYVIRRSLTVARERLSPRGRVPVLSVNVSALSLTDELPGFLADTLHEFHYPANRVCVEVTETSSITDMERTSRVLHELDGLGIVVSLDDFGTGFSSLTYLHQLPIGALKIDRSFVADMLTSRKALELVRSILHVARSLDLPVVAEGIETIEQSIMLQNLGCEQGQGFYFARPAPAEAACETIGRTLPFSNREVDPTKPAGPSLSMATELRDTPIG